MVQLPLRLIDLDDSHEIQIRLSHDNIARIQLLKFNFELIWCFDQTYMHVVSLNYALNFIQILYFERIMILRSDETRWIQQLLNSIIVCILCQHLLPGSLLRLLFITIPLSSSINPASTFISSIFQLLLFISSSLTDLLYVYSTLVLIFLIKQNHKLLKQMHLHHLFRAFSFQGCDVFVYQP